MDFAAAIKAGLKNYGNFRGVASRPAYWYWRLFVLLVSVATTFVPVVGQLASLLLVLPDTSIGIRRSRDAGFSAWWQLLWLAPVALIVWKFQAISQWFTALAVGAFDPQTATDEQVLAWCYLRGFRAVDASHRGHTAVLLHHLASTNKDSSSGQQASRVARTAAIRYA
jgi:uncharacterized membrane protein YhaH (DUF805 family)